MVLPFWLDGKMSVSQVLEAAGAWTNHHDPDCRPVEVRILMSMKDPETGEVQGEMATHWATVRSTMSDTEINRKLSDRFGSVIWICCYGDEVNHHAADTDKEPSDGIEL